MLLVIVRGKGNDLTNIAKCLQLDVHPGIGAL
jgi:hypothetical protein